MTKADVFYLILQGELWGKSPDIPEIPTKAYQQLLRMADMQTLTGMFCQSLLRHNVKLAKPDAINTYTTLRELGVQNQRIDQEVADLCQLMQRHGVDIVVVKGQTIASHYPTPKVRVPGDIDFYCDAQNFERAKEVLVREWGVDFHTHEDDEDTDQHIAFFHHGTDFEMHFRLVSFASKRNQQLFDKWIDDATPTAVNLQGTTIPTLPPTENLLYTFLHLYHHLIELGVGLRQFCDMAVLIHTYREAIDRRHLAEMLHALDFTRAFRAIEQILVSRMGLPEDELPIPLQPKDDRHEAAILDIVYKRGNFGKYGRDTKVRSGLRYYIKTMRIKVAHYGRLYRLAPRESRAVFLHAIPHKIALAFKRK